MLVAWCEVWCQVWNVTVADTTAMSHSQSNTISEDGAAKTIENAELSQCYYYIHACCYKV